MQEVCYGGTIDKCKLSGLNADSSGEVFDKLVHIEDDVDYNTSSKISSEPFHICTCQNNLPDCGSSPDHDDYLVYPGETFQVSVVAAGQRNGRVSRTVRSTVRTYYITDSHSVHLLDYQYLQHTNNTCTKLNYTVFSLSRKVKIELYPEGSPCSKYDDALLDISVDINQTCPPGFDISTPARSCVCEPRLAQYTNHCNITKGSRTNNT